MKKIVIDKPWPVHEVVFSPDGCLLAAGHGHHQYIVGGEGEVIVWQTKDWRRQSGYSGSFTDQAKAIAFTAGSKSLIAVSDKYIEYTGGDPWIGNIVYEWTVADGAQVNTIDINNDNKPFVGNVMSMALSPNDELVALDCLGSVPAILKRKSGRRAYELGGRPTQCVGLAFSPNGEYLVSIQEIQSFVHLYDAANGKELTNFDLKCANPSHVRWTEDHGNLLVGDRPTCVRFSPDGKQIAVGVSDGSVRLLAADLSKQLQSLEASDDKARVVAVAYAAKADLLAAATASEVRLFEASSGKQLRKWGKEELMVRTIALSPDGKLLAVGYGGKHNAKGWPRGGFVNIWNTKTGQLVKKLD